MGCSSSKSSRASSPARRTFSPVQELVLSQPNPVYDPNWRAPSPVNDVEPPMSLPQFQPPPPPFVEATLCGSVRAPPGIQLQLLFIISQSGHIGARTHLPGTPTDEQKLLLWDAHTMQRVEIDELDGDSGPDWVEHDVACLNAKQQRMDLVNLRARTSRPWMRGLGMLGRPWYLPHISAALPGSDIDRLVVGVDRKRRNVLQILGTSSARSSRRHVDEWKLGSSEITHLIPSPSGRSVITLSKDKHCRLTRFATGPDEDPLDQIYIPTNYPARLLGACQTNLGDGYHDYLGTSCLYGVQSWQSGIGFRIATSTRSMTSSTDRPSSPSASRT